MRMLRRNRAEIINNNNKEPQKYADKRQSKRTRHTHDYKYKIIKTVPLSLTTT